MLVVGFFAGCGSDEAAFDLAVPGPDLAVPCVVGDGGAEPTFASVQSLFDDQCVVCHSGSAQVVLTSGVAYSNLVNRMTQTMEGVDESCGGTLVVPGRPDRSYLYQKVAQPMPCAGAQMPKVEFGFDPLPDCQIDLLQRWILAGAPP